MVFEGPIIFIQKSFYRDIKLSTKHLCTSGDLCSGNTYTFRIPLIVPVGVGISLRLIEMRRLSMFRVGILRNVNLVFFGQAFPVFRNEIRSFAVRALICKVLPFNISLYCQEGLGRVIPQGVVSQRVCSLLDYILPFDGFVRKLELGVWSYAAIWEIF